MAAYQYVHQYIRVLNILYVDDVLTDKSSTLTKIDMKMIKKIFVPRISTYWEILQAYLMSDITADDESDKTYTGDPKQCCTALLEDWICSSKGDIPKTYAKLLEILNDIPELTGFTKIIQQSLEKEGILIGTYVCMYACTANSYIYIMLSI